MSLKLRRTLPGGVRLPALAVAIALAFTAGLGRPPRSADAQVGAPVTPRVHALIGARIVVAPGNVIPKGTIVVRDGLIEAVGAGVVPPPDARLWPADSLTIYAGFIEPYLEVSTKLEAPAAAPPGGGGGGGGRRGAPPPEPPVTKGIGAENRRVRPEFDVTALVPLERETLESLRNAGFTAAHVAPGSGVLRGSTAVVSLGAGSARDAVVAAEVAQAVKFETSGQDGNEYPGSLMGALALIRQSLYDARWYQAVRMDAAKGSHRGRVETNAALAALAPVLEGRRPLIFAIEDNLNTLRAAALCREFGVRGIAIGSGHEYQRIDAIRGTGLPLILPVDFPRAPKLKDPADERAVDTADLRHWALAAGNPAAVEKAGISWVFTAIDLKEPKDFRGRVREAIDRGLPVDRALAACTTGPAALLGVSDRLGTLAAGKAASFLVTNGDLFAEKTEIREVWVDGERHETAKPGAGKRDGRGRGKGRAAGGDDGGGAAAADSSAAGGGIAGGGIAGGGTAGRKSDVMDSAAAAAAAAGEVAPAGLMGDSEAWRTTRPAQPAALVVRNATIWTSGPAGKLVGADLLIRSGKVAAVGRDVPAPADALVIDAAGRHVTPGLIDCHSHTAISGGVNEGTNSVTAEVRVADVVNSETVNIYRELAGGLTGANLLHGSANAIGGQNQVIKMRFGALPEELKVAGAIPGIKFALGENPKQSNWGIQNPTRYPQSRMGVEQLIRERFATARDYERSWRDFAAGRASRPRKDLQLDAVLEILNGQRLIHSHSYRGDEILMLTRLCDDFGVKIGTFQHVLEGYKVADEMARHGAGGSCFSDWWAYKFEVYDAIPYAGAIMHDRGVTVSFNSDSSELARRMNYEAAKAIKYGGVSEEEALKFVTLNPARQLRIDSRVGSLEPGKDADFVLWNGDPLSNLTRADETWIDGRRYFSRAEDLANRELFAKERVALIGWAKKAGGGEEGGGWNARQHPHYLDEDGSDEACHDDGTHRHEEARERREAGR